MTACRHAVTLQLHLAVFAELNVAITQVNTCFGCLAASWWLVEECDKCHLAHM